MAVSELSDFLRNALGFEIAQHRATGTVPTAHPSCVPRRAAAVSA